MPESGYSRMITAQVLGNVGVMAAWTLTELALARSAPGSTWMPSALLVAWSISYLAGFRLAQRLLRSPDTWRAPYLLAALLVVAAGLLEGPTGDPFLAYVLASAALGSYTAASTTVVFNTTSFDTWRQVLAQLRLLSAFAYALVVAAVSVAALHAAAGNPGLVLPLAGVAVLVAGLSFRRPAVPEAALKQLDRATNALAFWEAVPRVTYRGLMSAGLLFSLAVMARVLTLRAYRAEIGPVEAMALYAVFYGLGSLIGVLRPQPGLVALAGLAVAAIHWLVDGGMPGGLVELSASLAFSGFAEAALILFILETMPAQLPRATLTLTMTMAATGLATAVLSLAGLSYELVLFVLALLAIPLQYRGVSWT